MGLKLLYVLDVFTICLHNIMQFKYHYFMMRKAETFQQQNDLSVVQLIYCPVCTDKFKLIKARFNKVHFVMKIDST